MNKESLRLLKESDALVDNCSRFLFFTRGDEFQREARDSLGAMHVQLEAQLREEQGFPSPNEDTCNRIYGQIKVMSAMMFELSMILSLKAGDMDKAWEHLVRAQSATTAAIRSHPTYAQGEMDEYAERLHMLEKHIFPKQMFLSSGLTVLESKCSICGSDYGSCEHIKFRMYYGKPCYRIVTQCDLREMSIVETPADKQCRALHFSDGDGPMRNLMTWRLVNQDSRNNDGEGTVDAKR